MAQMFPPSINTSKKINASELDVYMFLKYILPDDYYVFYNIRVEDSYPDFIIVGPTLGLITLEVKAWSLDFISNSNIEFFKLKDGTNEPNPMEKSEDFRNTIENLLKVENSLLQTGGIHKGKLKFPRCAGVVFPNIEKYNFINSEHRNSIQQKFILFGDEINIIDTTRNTELLLSNLKNMFVSRRSFSFDPLSSEDMDTIVKHLYKDSSFYKEENNLIENTVDDYKLMPEHIIDKDISSTDVTGQVKEEDMLEYLNHKKKFPFKKLISSLLVLTFLASLPYLHKIVDNYKYQGKSISEYIGSLFNSNINVLGKNFEENIDLFPPTMILKVQNNPYGKGTYILIQDGKNYISSRTFPKGSYIEFYNDKKIIIYDSKTSETKEFIAENDVIKLEVGNAYTKIYLNGIDHKFVKNFKYNFISKNIVQ